MAEGTDGAVRFRGVLAVTARGGVRSMIPIARCDIAESYNAGWQGRVVLAQRVRPGVSSTNYMSAMMARGALPGASASVHLTLRRQDGNGAPAEGDGLIVRSWPVGLGAVEPLETGEIGVAACSVQVMDPVTYLKDRAVWGAYRGCSLGEMVGGALSMAAGGNGRPTLTPAMPGLPPVTVRAAHRQSLDWLHYAVAAGQPFGEWLGEVAGLLGIRVEMSGTKDGDVVMQLTDMRASGQEIPARVVGVAPPDEAGEPADPSLTPVEITGMYGQPTEPIRAAVLDDIMQGAFRRVGGGSVGMVVEALGVDADEVAARMLAARRGRDAEMFALSGSTGQPGFRPGRVAEFNVAVRGKSRWQTAGVRHRLEGDSYHNTVTLFDGDIPWAPVPPAPRPDIIVPAVIDGGDDLLPHQPVPRDRMGRIPVRFPFLPSETAEEAEAREAADSDGDGEVTLSDFGTDEFADTVHWEGEVEAMRLGKFDDPFPGQVDTQLTEAQLAERTDLAARRRKTTRYLAYLQARERAREAEDVASRDRDQDGYVTARDALVSEDLATALADEAKRAELEEWQASVEMGTLDTDFPDLSEEDAALVEEYGGLFGPPEDQEDGDVRQAVREANAAAQKWPALLPLPVVNPMAGSLHGFIPSHRQGDACRVAVHGPFSAEVIGFQYRDDRPINAEIERATAGFVVEHDRGSAWSGFVFRPSEEVESD